MKTVIIYSSKRGTTGKVANMVGGKIVSDNDVTLIALSKEPMPDISAYGKVILGTSIYAGKPSSSMTKFCGRNKSVLENKVIGLFVCGIQSRSNKKEAELKNAYPDYLHAIAKAEDFMGGELLLEEMSFFERKLMEQIAKTDTSVSRLDNAAIDAFSDKMK